MRDILCVRVRASDERRDEVDAVGAEMQRSQTRRGQRCERQLREQVAGQILHAHAVSESRVRVIAVCRSHSHRVRVAVGVEINVLLIRAESSVTRKGSAITGRKRTSKRPQNMRRSKLNSTKLSSTRRAIRRLEFAVRRSKYDST